MDQHRSIQPRQHTSGDDNNVGAAMTVYDAVIVGSGPNGLTAAARLATLGWSVCVLEAAETIGGGCRTTELGVPGVFHDICAAAHPLGAASPAFEALNLAGHGVEWLHSAIACAHPFDDGDAAFLYRDLVHTNAQFSGDEWSKLFKPLLRRWDAVVDTLLDPLTRIPRHPIALAGLSNAAWPARRMARGLLDPKAAALFAGIAAHSGQPISRPMTAGVGLFLGAAAHAVGWPVAKGGSQAIVNALARIVVANGGTIETGRLVTSRADLPPSRVVLFDTDPAQFCAITGYAGRTYSRFRHGPGACKIDYVLSGPMPWLNDQVGQAATVHMGGSMHEILESQSAIAGDAHSLRPFVLVTQPAVADPSRRSALGQPLWAYCHVPAGSPVNASGTIERQFDRFAPGWRDLIRSRRVITAAQLARYNLNYVGGDVAGGSMSGVRSVVRPTIGRDPYKTPVERFWLCSASTPPGPGVHGMAGWHAVTSVLRDRKRRNRFR